MDQMGSRVSVVIPTYNRPQLLYEAVASIQAQSVPAFEIIVSDNHSRVRDAEIEKKLQSLGIRYHFHEEPLRMEEHWLWAIRQARGDLVAFLEDDNLFRANHLELLSSALDARPECSLAGSAAIVFGEGRQPLQRPVFAPVWNVDLLTLSPLTVPRGAALATYLFGSPFASSAVMFRRSAFEAAAPAVPALSISQDRWLWAQIAAQGDVVFVPELSAMYREHSGQIVKTFNGSHYRSEIRKVTDLVLGLMKSKGIDPGDALLQLAEAVPPGTLHELWFSALKSRNFNFAQTYRAEMIGTKSEVGVAREILKFSLRELGRRITSRI